MPRPKTKNDFQVAIKLPKAWIARADRLSKRLSLKGLAMTRTDVLRAAIAEGFDGLEQRARR